MVQRQRHRQSLKKRKSLRRSRRKTNGGGYLDGPDSISPGNLVHTQYPGPGKDCTGNPNSIRSGWVFDYNPEGLPGLSGGKQRNKNRKTYGGANSYGPITNPNLLPVGGSVTPKPNYFPNTSGTAGTVANPVVMSMPGVPPLGSAQMPTEISNLQKGGRYGLFPGMGPLNPVNGIGVSPPPFGRIPCEVGTYNSLNPDPKNIQQISTAPLLPPSVTSRGGGCGCSQVPALLQKGSGLSTDSANFPVVQVGQADSMRYYAPTAGYRNDFMTFQAPSAVPGLTIQTPYDAKAFNQACIKTNGGGRKNKGYMKNKEDRKNKGGALPVALDAGKFTPVTTDEVWTRSDFDGTNKGLPVKFGGKRRSRRVLKKKLKSRKHRKTF